MTTASIGPSQPVGDEVTLACLGVPVAVPASLAARCRHLSRTTLAPLEHVRDAGPGGIAELTACAVRRTALLAVHAAVVAAPRGVVVVPAVSGAGKSTLTAALLRRGFGYVSDEVLAVDRRTGDVTPFARPLALHAASWDVVSLPHPRPPDGGEGFVDPADIGEVSSGASQVAYVVVPERGRHALAVAPARPAEILTALLPRCFNHFRDTAASLRVLGDISVSARGWVARYQDAPELADALADVTGL